MYELQQVGQAVRAKKIVRQAADVGIADCEIGRALLDDRDEPG
jgi:hypothetical protein